MKEWAEKAETVAEATDETIAALHLRSDETRGHSARLDSADARAEFAGKEMDRGAQRTRPDRLPRTALHCTALEAMIGEMSNAYLKLKSSGCPPAHQEFGRTSIL